MSQEEQPPTPPVPPPPAGLPGGQPAPAFSDGKPMVDYMGRPASPRSRLACIILACLGWVIGIAGIHRFYVGKIGTGILMLITIGGLGIWTLIDVIMIATGSFKDKEERYVSNW